ncbi:hypothetical protein MPDQ_003547 [Monascus purpureus]|uniref:Uncharacterized protein n=1 Tax=Monascus purpureus TaxID=5098 RepID=A0A507QIM7_MONPU|nr:hypothetical protein MPDQ_003547 [Monascus purpureus]BDD58413.1 hypothetical protein MAP00_003693 [Monascus purpureus]
MPTSTVFSYLRRERHRSSASLVNPSASQQRRQSSSPAKENKKRRSTSSSPATRQIPANSTSSPLATTVDQSTAVPAVSSENESENPPSFDTDKRNNNNNHNHNRNNNNENDRAGTTSGSNVSSSSPTTRSAPAPSSADKLYRPHSSPEERASGEIASNTPISNQSQTVPDQDYAEIDSSKSSTPFRLSFPRAILKAQTHSEGQKRSPTPIGLSTTTSHFRFKSSVEGELGYKDKDKDKTVSSREVLTEHAHHKSGKGVLQLLNPMSLLARRRSSHIAGSRTTDTNTRYPGSVPAIPEDYDPRIRGNIVHDFSAPRPRRNVSSAATLQRSDANWFWDSKTNSSESQGPNSRRSRQHLPAFKENFDDDENALQVENKGYLNSELLTNQLRPEDERSIPVFARNLPSRIPDSEEIGKDRETTAVVSESLPASQEEGLATQEKAPDDAEDATQPQSQPQLQLPSGLPKRFKSDASRFSFDMNGLGSSVEEKLLEEKHKKKQEAARQAKAQLGEEDNDRDCDFDDFDSGMFDEMDYLEEKIPGVNVDADEDDNSYDFPGAGNALRNPLYSTGLSPDISTFLNPVNSNLAALSILQDTSQNDGVANANANASSEVAGFSPGQCSVSPMDSGHDGLSDQADIQSQDTIEQNISVESQRDGEGGATELGTSQWNNDDDDLYFDDGEFDDLKADDVGGPFDESIFDDETSHLYDRNTPAARLAAERLKGADAALERISESEVAPEEDPLEGLKNAPSMASEFRRSFVGSHGQTSERPPNSGPSYAHGGVLSEQNLAAFHDALAKAASEANTTNGRFGRAVGISGQSVDQESVNETSHTLGSHPGLVSDDSRSQVPDVTGLDDVFEHVNYDEMDDDNAFYDDPIIAAANAEALENDDEGFYGQEFGFYPQAPASWNSELTNGGYFGPRGTEGISRSHSGRGKFQEPSLTPITERSEWSTRNSIASLSAFGLSHPQANSPGPGLAQLVDMGHNIDDEMSLSTLLKFRREAWSGSDGSLSSGANSPPPPGPASAPYMCSNRSPSSVAPHSYSRSVSMSLSMADGEDPSPGLLESRMGGYRSSWAGPGADSNTVCFNKNTDDNGETKSI